MSNLTNELKKQIQELPLSDMIELHESLIATIQEREDKEGLDPMYKAELVRRVNDIKSGSVKGVNAFTSLEEM